MKCLLALTLILVLLGSFVPATVASSADASQNFRSGISGRITDPNGSVVVGATITIVSRSSHTSVSHKSNTEGEYAVDLEPDTYDVSVAAQGFKTSTRKSIYVGHEARPYVDFVLEVAPPVTPRLIN